MAKLSKELEKAAEKFDEFQESVTSMTMDASSAAPKVEQEPQTKLSQKELNKDDGIWLKPERSLDGVNPKTGEREKFNEKFRAEYEFKKEYVPFIAEHKEIIGETIETWTKRYPGTPAEFWKVPTNKKVWGPRYLAEQISKCSYTRLEMKDNVTDRDGHGAWFGQMTATNRIQRLDAKPARNTRQLAMSSEF